MQNMQNIKNEKNIKNKYNVLTPRHAEDLRELIGARNVDTAPDKLCAYSHDEVPSSAYEREYIADLLVFPQTTQHVSDVMKYATQHIIPVTPRGAGTGLSGGAVPALGGIVMSFERMNAILELDLENLTITAEPGVVTSEITKAAAASGLLYAGDPCSGDASFIGGNVAENAGGNKVIKYGATGAQVLALEVVLPNGDITQFGGKRKKDVTGYDLCHLIVGSEGTLAVITKIILRLLPMPKFSVDLLISFNSIEEATAFVPKIITEAKILPASLELLDASAMQLAQKYLSMTLPGGDSAAALIIQLEDNDKEILSDQYEAIGDMCIAAGAIEVYVADNRNSKERLWKARKAVPEAISFFYDKYLKEDIVVPLNKIPETIAYLEILCTKHAIDRVNYGHVGDGNLHVSLLAPRGRDDWKDVLHAAQTELYEYVNTIGGTLSGEHGIGLKRRNYTKYFLDDATRNLIRRIKAAFDPLGILNPGKIIEDLEGE